MPQCLIGNVKIHVEVPILLIFFVFMFEGSVTTNLIMYRTCYLILGFNKSECALLGSNIADNLTIALEKKVQPYASLVVMSPSIIEAVIPPMLCFFIGPWSDNYGRKPVMLFSLGGFVLGYVIKVLIAAFPNVSPWYILLCYIPIGLSGGFPSIFIAVLSYIADTTSDEYRGVRMGVLEAMLTVGGVAGTLSSSFFLYSYGYVAVYSVCVACMLLALAFTFLFIPESLTVQESNQEKFKRLFDINLAKDTITTTFRRRDGYGRLLIISIILLMTIFVLACIADGNVIFLYLRDKFQWSLETFTFYSAISNVIWIAGSIIGAYILNKLLRVTETAIIFAGMLSTASTSIFLALATRTWHVYAAGSLKCLGGAVGPMARSLLSKLVPAEEAGKVFTVVTALETVGAIGASPLYTFIYDRTLLVHPETFNFLTAGILVFEAIFVGAIYFVYKKHGNFNNEENSAPDEEQRNLVDHCEVTD